jgi:hypothetical protein
MRPLTVSMPRMRGTCIEDAAPAARERRRALAADGPDAGRRMNGRAMEATSSPLRWPLRVAAVVAVGFGLLTIKSGGAVLAGGEAARAAGQVVPFVLWFNFAAGFAYVAAGIGLWMRRRWAAWLAVCVAVATLTVFAAFGIHVAIGGEYETRTVGAMTLRSAVWVAIAALACRALGCRAGKMRL